MIAAGSMRRAVSPGPAVLAFALGLYGVLLLATAPPWPDDWDGIGFVESVGTFDLARFRPHPPGYPVYVGLLRVAAVVASAPMRACILVAACSGLVTIGLAWDAARRASGERVAWMVAALVGMAPGVWRAFSGVGSEAPALACAAACAWGLVAARTRPDAGATVVGLAAGFGLGARLSWGPLYVAALVLVPRGSRVRGWIAMAAACVAWAVPLAGVVGAARLAGLCAQHVSGHAGRWGGTVVTDPGSVRFVWLARDVFVDGFGVGSDLLGLVTAGLMALAMARALVCWRAARWCQWRTAIVSVVPYLLWIGLGQNLRDQPRHALPLVALVAAWLSLPAARSRGALVGAAALALAASIRTAVDARERHAIAPPGQQLVELVRRQPLPSRLTVFGGASVRFFEQTELASRARPAGSLAEARMDLTRFDGLPARVWVTSELGGLGESRWPLERIATLCRPARLDRRMPCLDVYGWTLPFL